MSAQVLNAFRGAYFHLLRIAKICASLMTSAEMKCSVTSLTTLYIKAFKALIILNSLLKSNMLFSGRPSYVLIKIV